MSVNEFNNQIDTLSDLTLIYIVLLEKGISF